jgi:hypothetical protein
MPPSNPPFLLPWEILITLLILGAFPFLFSKIIIIDSIKNRIFQNNTDGNKIVILLGIAISGFVFIINTSFISMTGVYNPPHGTTFGFWDGYNIEQDQFVGGFALFNDNEVLFLPIALRDPSLKYISKERLQRYLRPPFLRDKCYTGNRIGCVWVDIDIANFNQVLQWLDYLTQITLGILSGLIGNKIMWWQIKKNDLSQKAAG